MQTGLVNTAGAANWWEAGLFEYFLVAPTDAATGRKVMEEKKTFFDLYKPEGSIRTRPDIRIAGFFAREAMEDTLIKWIHRICSRQTGFLVALNNFSGFQTHTIYLRVLDPAPFLRLAEELKVLDPFLQSCACPALRLSFKPHLCIAGKLEPAIYSQAIMAYSQKIFHERFMVEELQLLRRAHPYDPCKTVNVFRFLPAELGIGVA